VPSRSEGYGVDIMHIFIGVGRHITPWRATLSDCRQPFDEALLAGMPFADGAQSAGEVLNRAPFLCFPRR
jgi:hypothetical protein